LFVSCRRESPRRLRINLARIVEVAEIRCVPRLVPRRQPTRPLRF
jgi:hypothetical protein